MLSSGPQSARPRPPAHLKRSVNTANNSDPNNAQSPPPPYQVAPEILDGVVPLHRRNLSVCSVSSNVDASVAAAAAMLGLEVADSLVDQGRGITEEYIREKSREELEKLLFKAEAVIRARERELGVAANVGKQLLETNLSLRERHASLLSKTPPFSLGASAAAAASQPETTPPMSPLVSPRSSYIFRTPNQIHTRRISASPSQLATLSSQNEDLIQALAKLQDETSAANMEGKQKLRKLEKEIAGLRGDLEHSHQKNEELAQRIDKVQVEHEQQIEVKKQERETKMQEMRDTSSRLRESPSFANFAPLSQHSTPRKSTGGSSSEGEQRPPLISFPSTEVQQEQPTPSTSGRVDKSAELAILGQLLAKIEELESTNREILGRYRETDGKLKMATNRSDALQEVYKNLEDEMYADDEEGTFSADQSPLVLPDGASGLDPNFAEMGFVSARQPLSLRERGSPVPSLRGSSQPLATSISRRSRMTLSPGSLTGRAEADHDDHPVDEDSEQDEATHRPAGIKTVSALKPKKSSAFTKRRVRPKASLDSRLMRAAVTSSHLSPPMKSIRPSVSYHDLGDVATQDFPAARSLQEELELEQGQPLDVTDMNSADQEEVADGQPNGPPIVTVSEPAENPAVAAIRDALDPQNQGRPLEDGEHILPIGSLEGSPSESFFLLSHAVNARPTKWNAPPRRAVLDNAPSDIRNRPSTSAMSAGLSPKGHMEELRHSDYTEESETERDVRGEKASRPAVRKMRSRIETLYTESEAVPSRRVAALSRLNETAANRSSRPRSRKSRSSRASEAEPNGQDLQRRPNRRDENVLPKDGWSRTLLEIWIFLQAAIILFVFVYSMARRGPRAILDAAEVNKNKKRSR
ncbi:hypothetical protein FRC18_005652 [Serendipita sp. 400]|nr:hypothetical protein FRC18_005652 [Serendipita sp. 400]